MPASGGRLTPCPLSAATRQDKMTGEGGYQNSLNFSEFGWVFRPYSLRQSLTMAGRFARWLGECFALFLGQAGLARRTVTGPDLSPADSTGPP